MSKSRKQPLRIAALACFAFGLLSLAWFAASGSFALLSLPIVLLMCAHYFAFSVLVAYGWCRVRNLDPPELPFVLSRWSGTRGALIAAAAVFLVTWGLREGAFAPTLVINFDMHSFNQDTDWSSDHTVSGLYMEQPVVMAGQLTSCLLPQCSPRGTFCDAFLAELSCDNPEGPEANPVTIDITMSRGGVGGCYVPLFKSTNYNWNAQVDMYGTVPGGNKRVSLSVNGDSSASMQGFGSCFTYQHLAGRDLAHVVAGVIRDTLAAN